MADITFNCPLCQQPIQCDDQWAGQQIQCPLCQGALIAPPAPSAPAASPAQSSPGKQVVARPTGNKLGMQHNAQKPATPGRNIPIRNLADAGPVRKKQSPAVGLAIGAAVFVVCAAGGYFGWTKYQEHVEAKKAEAARQAEEAAKAAKEQERAQAAAQAAASGLPAPNAPITPPAYTLDVATAKIPQCAVNGSIGGSNFVAELIRVDAVGASQVLRLTQGSATQPEREFLIYLGLKPGDKLSGHTWTISSDMKGLDVPRVIKRWKVRQGYPPAMKTYATGYAMQLELGQVANGAVPGKIFIALPDPEQSVAGGMFQAQTTLPEVIGAASVPGAMPAPAPAPGPAANSRYNNRYR